MKICEKTLIENLDWYTGWGFISVIDGKDIHWSYAYHDGEQFYLSPEVNRVCYIGHSRNGLSWTFFDVNRDPDPRRAEVLADWHEAIGE